jgi:hypothetical protein
MFFFRNVYNLIRPCYDSVGGYRYVLRTLWWIEQKQASADPRPLVIINQQSQSSEEYCHG